MRISEEHEAHTVALLTRDVGATLGAGHEGDIRSEASFRRSFFNEPDVDDFGRDQYIEKVAENVQQYFHDCFVDNTLPECPLHRRHPLWLRDGYWTCEQSNTRIARLGALRASRSADGRYVITPG